MRRYVNGTQTNAPPPSGAASGDLGGTYPAPTVAGLQGRDVARDAPSEADVLAWNDTLGRWEPTAPLGAASGDLKGTYPAPTVVGLQGRDVANDAPSEADVLAWNDTLGRWEPTAPSGGGGQITAWDAPVNDGSWLLEGTASIGGGLITLSALSATSDAGRAVASRAPSAATPSGLELVADPNAFDAVIRVASLVGNSETFAGLYARLRGSDEIRLWATGAGGVACGYLGSLWTPIASVGSGFPLGGTGWLKLSVRGPVLSFFYGTGTTTEPPAETAWTRLADRDVASVRRAGFRSLREIGPSCASYGGGVNITATFDRLRVRNAGPSTRVW